MRGEAIGHVDGQVPSTDWRNRMRGAHAVVPLRSSCGYTAWCSMGVETDLWEPDEYRSESDGEYTVPYRATS